MFGLPAELVVSGLLSTAGVWFIRRLLKQRRSIWEASARCWTQLAKQLGLSIVTDAKSGHITLSGRFQGFEVTIETQLEGTLTAPITRFTVDMPDVLPPDLRIIRAESSRPTLYRRVELGDPAFDDQLVISGSTPMVYALFNATARKRALEEIDLRTQIARGAIIRDVPGQAFSLEAVVEIAGAMIELGRSLRISDKEIDRRLLESALDESCLGIRRNLYTLLLQPGSSTKLSNNAAHLGRFDTDPFIQLLSSLHLGPENFDEVERIAREESLPHEVRLFAFGHLAARGDALWLRGFLGRVMRIDGRSAQRAVLRSLVATRRTDLAPAIAECGEHPSLTPETMFEISEALGRLGDETAEATLCRFLHAPVVPLRLSAVHALANVGSIRAVEPLHSLTKNFLLEPREVRDAARDAIRIIQGRIADADAGRLSVIDPDDQRGAVSYLHPQQGALSLKK